MRTVFLTILLIISWAAHAEPQQCDKKVTDAVTLAAGKEYTSKSVIDTSCKVWSYQSNTILAAVAYEISPYSELQDGSDIAIVVAVVRQNSNVVLAHATQDASEDSSRRFYSGSMTFDTARYDIASGRRAFGLKLDNGHSPRMASGGESEYLTLYLQAGKSLRSLIHNLPTTHSQDRSGYPTGDGDAADIERAVVTLELAKNATHGFKDINVIARTDKQQSFQRTISYDGKAYSQKDWEGPFYNWWIPGRFSECAISPTTANLGDPADLMASAVTTFAPAEIAGKMLPQTESIARKTQIVKAAAVELQTLPKHGRVMLRNGISYGYIPENTFSGEDRFQFRVLIAGQYVEVGYTMKVLPSFKPNEGNANELLPENCPTQP